MDRFDPRWDDDRDPTKSADREWGGRSGRDQVGEPRCYCPRRRVAGMLPANRWGVCGPDSEHPRPGLAPLQHAHVHGVVSFAHQIRDGSRRDAGVGQEAHRTLCRQGVQLVLGQCGRVSERLADVLGFQVWQVRDDVSGTQAVGHEIDDVGHRNAEPTNGGPPCQEAGMVRDAIQWVRHRPITYGHSSPARLMPRRVFNPADAMPARAECTTARRG